MAIITNLILAILSIAAIATSGVFTIISAMKIKDAHNYSSDDDYQDAHKYLSWASIVTWISLATLLALIVIYFIFFSATAEITGKWFVMLIILILVILLGFSGVLSSMAAQKIKASKNYGDDDSEKSFKDSIISAALSLGTIVILILFVLIVFVASAHKS